MRGWVMDGRNSLPTPTKSNFSSLISRRVEVAKGKSCGKLCAVGCLSRA